MKYKIKARANGKVESNSLFAPDILTAEQRADEIYGASNVFSVVRSDSHDFSYRGSSERTGLSEKRLRAAAS